MQIFFARKLHALSTSRDYIGGSPRAALFPRELINSMKFQSIFGLALLLALTCASKSAFAIGVVEQHPATSEATAGLASNLPSPQQQIADDFHPATNSMVTHLSWSGLYFNGGPAPQAPTLDFTVRFYDESGSPNAFPDFSAVVAATYVQTGTTDFFNDPIYRFSAELPTPYVAAANRPYWLSVLESDAVTATPFSWIQSLNNYGQRSAVRHSEGGSWTLLQSNNHWDFAFTLEQNPRPQNGAPAVIDDVFYSLYTPIDDGVIHQFTAADAETPDGPFTWDELTLISYTPRFQKPGTGPALAPTLSPSGLFTWNSIGSPTGIYVWSARVTDPGGLSDVGTFLVQAIIPEPATVTLVGLSMMALVGFTRRR
jgi:hypothetical protein